SSSVPTPALTPRAPLLPYTTLFRSRPARTPFPPGNPQRTATMETPARKQRGADKTARIPIKIVPAERLKKPEWIRIKLGAGMERSEEHTSELQSRENLVCRLLLEKK